MGRPRHEQPPPEPDSPEPPPDTPSPTPGRRGGRGSGPKSSGSRSPSTPPSSPLELERGSFTAPDDGAPHVEPELDELPPAPEPEPIEWTPERAGAVVRGIGFALHTVDAMGQEPGGAELWRATEDDAAAIGPPLARILNRYAPARRLAGLSDEAELAFALGPYVKRNAALRGRLVRERKDREDVGRDEWGAEAPGSDAPPYFGAPPEQPGPET